MHLFNVLHLLLQLRFASGFKIYLIYGFNPFKVNSDNFDATHLKVSGTKNFTVHR